MKNIDKRIEKLNSKIERNMKNKKNGKDILCFGVISGVVFGSIPNILELCGCRDFVVVKDYMAFCSSCIAGVTFAYIRGTREKRIEKYINELHGYALEENKTYTKKF